VTVPTAHSLTTAVLPISSLREAICLANANGEADTIDFDRTSWADSNITTAVAGTGDYDITSQITIQNNSDGGILVNSGATP